MKPKRPDLNQVPPTIKSYIEALEAELDRLLLQINTSRTGTLELDQVDESQLEESIESPEPPTTVNIITLTASGIGKRTPRHLYNRQRRGGMGVFDLQISGDQAPAVLTIADQDQTLLLLTNQARAFRLPVNTVPEMPVRGRGESVVAKWNLASDELLITALPIHAQGYIAILSHKGYVRLLRHHVFGEYMKPGMTVFDVRTFGYPVAACWTPGEGDLFIATRQGRAIRFPEKLVPPQGGPGIRLLGDDQAIGICSVFTDSGVFLINEDGKGTIRLMEGFIAQKSMGVGGKIAISTNLIVAVSTVSINDEIFLISRLGKIIRFQASEVPFKEGIVQGVNCMNFRGDKVVALSIASPLTY